VPDVHRRPAAVPGEVRAQVVAVEIGDHPAGDRELRRDPVRLALPVVGDDDADCACRLRLLGFRRERADAAFDEHERAFQRTRRQLPLRRLEVAGRAAEVALDRLRVASDDGAHVHERLVGRCQSDGASEPFAPMNGMPCSNDGAPARSRSSAGEKTCVFDTAATEIASGAVPGEPADPRPKSSRSLPAAITGTTPAAATLWIAATSASFAGSICGPPPEKLITSMPSRTAASKAAMISGVFATCPIGVGTVKTR